MKNYEINEDLATGILNYLVTRPYQEVYQAVQALQSLKEVEETKKTNEKK